jgi:hypothetical protein
MADAIADAIAAVLLLSDLPGRAWEEDGSVF